VLSYLKTGDDPYNNISLSLDLNNQQYALITGTVFTVSNSLFGLVLGYMADVFNRKYLLLVTTILCTAMTFSMVYTNNFIQILFPRILFSVFSGACIPASVSLITDYYQHELRGRANSVFAFGIYLGGGLSSISIIID
jgi:MFS family permease